MLGDMASIASSVRNLLGKAEDQKPHPSNHVRVRQSILTTNKKQEQRERRKFMKIFKQVEEETTTGAGSHSPKRKPRESGDAKLRSRSKKPKSKNIAPNTLSDALSSQPNASLHFGMEVSLCSNFFDPTLKSKKYSSSSASADEPRFLAVTHPDGHTQVLGNSKIRAGAGEYRGGEASEKRSDEIRTRSCLRTRHAYYATTATFFVPCRNPFRDSLRSS